MKFILNLIILIIWFIYQAAFYAKVGIIQLFKSAAFKTSLIILVALLVLAFIPYWAGLVIIELAPGLIYINVGLCWAVGGVYIMAMFVISVLSVSAWLALYDKIKR